MDVNIQIPELVQRILSQRGFSGSSLQLILSPTLKDLKDPLCLDQMDLAVARLVTAIQKQEKICIYADYDLDGTSGSVLLAEALRKLQFKHVEIYQPDRFREGYGLKSNVVEDLATKGIQLIVTVDLGITAVDEVARANQLGIDVIVTDHHLPAKSLPQAIAVVNPNKGTCPSGLTYLSGTGVAFYLAMALRRELIRQGLAKESDLALKSLLDLYSLGTLTDMVPLKNENRVLVRHGLVQLAQTSRAGLKALIDSVEITSPEISSLDVSFRIAPKLNALSRMDNDLQPIDLYTVEDMVQAKAWVQEVWQSNDLRRSFQNSADQIAAEYLSSHHVEGFVWLYSDQIHRGIMGLVATKVTQQTGLPSFVGHLTPSGTIVGSSRAPAFSDVNLAQVLDACSSSLHQFGGHAKAAGFELDSQNAERFRRSLEEYFRSAMNRPAQNREWVYDSVAKISELDANYMNWLRHLEPFGTGFSVPTFVLEDHWLVNPKRLKGDHWRFDLRDSDGNSYQAIWFSPPPTHAWVKSPTSAKVRCWVEPQWNHFQGRKKIQLLVHDLYAC